MIEHDVGFGFKAVPEESVCLNGLYMSHLNSEYTEAKSCGRFCVVGPNGQALMSDDGKRPARYRGFLPAKKVKALKELKEALK